MGGVEDEETSFVPLNRFFTVKKKKSVLVKSSASAVSQSSKFSANVALFWCNFLSLLQFFFSSLK